MKLLKIGFFLGLFTLMLSAQTVDLGTHVFYNEEGAINLAVDANMAVRILDSPYVPFVLYMGADPSVIANINRSDVTLVHDGRSYQMVDLKVLRKEYDHETRDYRMYSRFTKDNLALSKMRYYRFQTRYDFFPPRASNIRVTDEASVSETIGFRTFAYFKNPGFKDGDTIIINVVDKKDSDVWGASAVVLKEIK
jgi:hypothetical protein